MDLWFLFFSCLLARTPLSLLLSRRPSPGFFLARAALPILQQGLCLHHFLGVFVVSHEEFVSLLLFQTGVPRIIRLLNKKAAAELFAGGFHRLLFVIGVNEYIHRCLVFIHMLQNEPLPVFLYRRSWSPGCPPWDFTVSQSDLKI